MKTQRRHAIWINRAIFVLVVLVAGVLALPTVVPTPYESTKCTERRTAGLICESCSKVATCVQNGGQWESILVENCVADSGLYCNRLAGGCSSNAGPCNRVGYEQNFVCTSVGVFPDPYDCQRYHMCFNATDNSVLVAMNAECEGDRAFSPTTGDCSVTLADTVCTDAQFRCTDVGDHDQWPGNPNIFYVCKATMVGPNRFLYPTIYRCAASEMYDGEQCVPRTGGNWPPIGQPPRPPGSTPGQEQSNYTCTDRGLFRDARDCHAYVHCDHSLQGVRHRCVTGSYFEQRHLSCVLGDCNRK